MATLEQISRNIQGRSGPTANTREAGKMIQEQVSGWISMLDDLVDKGKDLPNKEQFGKFMGFARQETTKGAEIVKQVDQAYTKMQQKIEADFKRMKAELPSKGEKAIRDMAAKAGYKLDPKVPDLGEALAKRANWELAMHAPAVYAARREVYKAMDKVGKSLENVKKSANAWAKENSRTGTISGAIKSQAKQALIDVKNAIDRVETKAANMLDAANTWIKNLGNKNEFKKFVDNAALKIRQTDRKIVSAIRQEVRQAPRQSKYTSKKKIDGKWRYFYD